MASELQKLRRRVMALETALLPFAAEADTWTDAIDSRYRPGVTEPRERFSYAKAIGDLRRARRLLFPMAKR